MELKESDGKKIAVSGISTAEEISPQLGFKRCRVYGEKELEVQVGSLQKDLINILDSVDYIYTKLKLSLGVSEDIDKNVKNIESVFSKNFTNRSENASNWLFWSDFCCNRHISVSIINTDEKRNVFNYFFFDGGSRTDSSYACPGQTSGTWHCFNY